MMSGQDVPRLYCSGTDRDGDFDGAVPDLQVVAEAWDAWRAEVDFATRFVAEAPSLDITGRVVVIHAPTRTGAGLSV
jgi:hypothetical protein